MIILGLFIILSAAVLVLQERIPFIEKIGGVTVCYALGIALGNLPWITVPEWTQQFAGAMIAAAIPILLFKTELKIWLTLGRPMIISFLCCVVAVSVASTIGVFLFLNASLPDKVWILASMMVGVFVGGTPNLAAIGWILDVDKDAFVVLHASEVVIGGLWLLFLLTAAGRVFAVILAPAKQTSAQFDLELDERLDWKGSAIALALGFLAMFVGVLLTLPIPGMEVPGANGEIHVESSPAQLVVLFLTVTVIGVLLSRSRTIRNLKGSYGMGNFLLFVFCVAIGSLADMQEVINKGVVSIAFVAVIILLTIGMHMLLVWLLGIDRDTFIISSTAALYGPPFIPPVAKAIGNPQVISLGIALSLLGLAVGTSCGIGMSYLLRLM
jgi:uncharacterized membrane protein